MACLERPLTVIGGGSGDQNVDLDAVDRRFLPPAATWYDECNQHFVALLEKKNDEHLEDSPSLSLDGPTIPSSGGSETFGGDIAYYQTLSMPPRQQQHAEFERSALEDDDCGGGGDTAFEEVRDKFKGERQSLAGSKPVAVVLPSELVVVHAPPAAEGGDDRSVGGGSPTPGVPRVPILAKFSLDSRLLALQFTDSMVRIARVAAAEGGGGGGEMGGDSAVAGGGGSGSGGVGGGPAAHLKQWTIDLSIDSTPVATAAGSMPPPRRPSRMRGLAPRRAWSFGGSSSKDDGVTGETKILPGGVIWSNHGGNSEDLLLITTTSVLFYKISCERNHMAKSRSYPHPFVAGFWFEPKARALLVGSYTRKDAKLKDAVGARAPSSRDNSPPPPMVMVMRTYFLNSPPTVERSDSSSSFMNPQSLVSTSFGGETPRGPSSFDAFPRLELPPPERLEPFIVGGQRNTVEGVHDSTSPQGSANSGKAQSNREQVVSLDDVHLVNVYGDVYCVELGCLGGDGVGVHLFHLDKKGGRVSVDQIVPPTFQMPPQPGSNFVSVLDNLICIHSKGSRSSLFLDVKDTPNSGASEDMIRIIVTEERPGPESIFNEGYSFLPPCFLLNPEGRGHLHQMRLTLPRILKAMPASKAALPLLLRRKSSPATVHTLALRHLNEVVIDEIYSSAGEQSVELKMWISSIVGCYAINQRVATAWDLEACHPLIFKAAVLKANPAESEVMPTTDLFSICSRTPSRCAAILTQSELLEGLLIPRATVAISAQDMHMLRYILDLTVLFYSSFEERSLVSCPAFECLIVALSWRLGDFVEVNSFLTSKQVCRAAQKHRLQQISTSEVDGEQKVAGALEEAMNSGLEMFSEMLLMLSKEDVSLPSCSAGSSSTGSRKQLKATLVRHAIDIFCTIGSYQLAAKHLLEYNRVIEAMTVCSNAVALHSLRPSQRNPNELHHAHGRLRADDFFRAAVNKSSALPGMGDRVRLFFYMHTFIKEYDPGVLQLESRPATQRRTSLSYNAPQRRASFVSGAGDPHNSISRRRLSAEGKVSDDLNQQQQDIEQSVLAHNYGAFPSHLFGGRKADVCRQLRDMFGFSDHG